MPSLAPYAVHDDAFRGRLVSEQPFAMESPFELDRARILASTSFRRLRYKTQVFVTDCGDHFRTRLTHTLEVDAQAQRLARLLSLNEALCGAIALAHDLGHPPFGHAGEQALSELMKDHGGFEHNLQSLRVVDYLEHPYPAFRGLNLSFEVREALLKHQTRYDHPGQVDDPELRDLLAGGPQATLEGQVVNLADAIAYTLHDIEDGLLETALDEAVLSRSRLWREAAEEIQSTYGAYPLHAVRRPILDEIARKLQQDVAQHTTRLISERGICAPDHARSQPQQTVSFSDELRGELEELQTLLLEVLYRSSRVVRMDTKAKRLVHDVFCAYLDQPRLLPDRFAQRIDTQGPHRVICDYIAGMTDRFCQEEHRRLFAPFHFG